MEPVTALMLLITCNDDMRVCREAARSAQEYVSVAACEEGLEKALKRVDDGPQRIGQCLPIAAGHSPSEVSLIWHMSRRGELYAELRPINGVDSGPTRLAGTVSSDSTAR
ncbi:MAG: hypothetical protein H6883_13565 [Rhodobiaceae bacterium]|nr:hypothetical protein [Rhodobiaceae bacterium]MCC0057145.1 hypothetical protein [Rhodobiaceae bacterium]